MSKTIRRVTAAALFAWGGLLAGCSPEDLVGEGELPPDVSNPETTNTPTGAMAAYRGAVLELRRVVGEAGWYPYIQWSGLFTDELETVGFSDFFPTESATDRRFMVEYVDPETEAFETANSGYVSIYRRLHGVRGAAREAARLLRAYAPDASPALAAHAEAVEGYADLYLADFFCSGVPLSTIEGSGYTLRPGSTTEEVYEAALTLFQSALSAATDSARIASFARVGQGRALLALGRYADAAAAVAAVADEFEYRLEFSTIPPSQDQPTLDVSYVWAIGGQGVGFSNGPTMADLQGGNGLDFMSSGDLRTEPAQVATSFEGGPIFLPASMAVDGSTPIVIAGGREARLIEAEAALQGGDVTGWLDRLNALRRAAVFPPAPSDPSGIPRTLPDLVDPGTPEARVDLLFRERGFWLYLTGHRQGDLRRLVREYGRDPNTVYPVGIHPRGASYGADMNSPIPAIERKLNPHFTGCADRGA